MIPVPRRVVLAALSLSLAALPASASAQTRLFPRVPSVELPSASPRAYGIVGRVLAVRQGESRFGRETEGDVGIGEAFPLFALRRGPRPVTLGFGVQVYGRFSLTDPKSALISNDWVVGFNAAAELDAWQLVGELYHESSHLGDEYADHFNASRLDWTRETAAARGRYRFGRWIATGQVSYVLQDQLGLARPAAALALDYTGRGARRRVYPVAGIYLDAAAETSWRVSTSARVGLEFSGSAGSRALGLALVAHDGLSTQRQFFRQESRYLGAELRFDL